MPIDLIDLNSPLLLHLAGVKICFRNNVEVLYPDRPRVGPIDPVKTAIFYHTAIDVVLAFFGCYGAADGHGGVVETCKGYV